MLTADAEPVVTVGPAGAVTAAADAVSAVDVLPVARESTVFVGVPPADALPEPADALPEPPDPLPEPDGAAPEPVDAPPEPDDALPEPDDALPEPVDALPEPDDALPEPVEVLPEEVVLGGKPSLAFVRAAPLPSRELSGPCRVAARPLSLPTGPAGC